MPDAQPESPRHAPDLAAALAATCPNGVAGYFDLTGGAILQAVLPLLNAFARVLVCGTTASFNATTPPPGPDRRPAPMRLIQTRSLTLRGLIVSAFAADRAKFLATMSEWLAFGVIKAREDVTHGLDQMVSAFLAMLEGRNFGKALVHLAD